MFTIQVPTAMRRVAAPMSCAVAITSLFTSAAKMPSNPASSASLATAWMSFARQPTPGMMPSPRRSAMTDLRIGGAADGDAGEPLEDLDDGEAVFLVESGRAGRLVELLRHVGEKQWDTQLLGERRLQLLILERE